MWQGGADNLSCIANSNMKQFPFRSRPLVLVPDVCCSRGAGEVAEKCMGKQIGSIQKCILYLYLYTSILYYPI